MTYAPSKNSDQPRHLCTAVHSYQKLTLWLTTSSGEWFRSDWTDAQTDWLHMPFCRFRYVPVYLYRRSHIWACAWQNLKKSCVPSEDSDQPVHLPSLIRVFAVRMKKHWVLSNPLSACTVKTLIRLAGCPGWSEFSLGTHQFVGFVMLQLIFL